MNRVRITDSGKDYSNPQHSELIFTVQLALITIWELSLLHVTPLLIPVPHPCALPQR